MTTTNQRLISLDTMRGFTIAAMIMVNFPGSEEFIYAPLRHSTWNGLTFTDLIAPTFLYIIGVSIVLAYSKKLASNSPKTELYKKILFRSIKIFAVGIFLNLLPDFNFSELRYTGTLQRIAIVFLVSAVLYLKTSSKQQIILFITILVGYHLAMNFIPTPGIGRVMLEPGINLAAWVDQQYMPGVMWQGNWDPEGILSTFPSIATCISGIFAGNLIISRFTPNEKANYLMAYGFVALLAGYLWGLSFPINENLWSSSFVLLTSGFASILFGAVYFFVDICKRETGTFVGVVFGANAITVFVLADIFALLFYIAKFGEKTFNEHVVSSLIGLGIQPELASMLFALCFVSINFIPALWLYRKKIFIKI